MPLMPNNCVILGIDPGKVSGWAIFHKANFIDAGIAKTNGERLSSFNRALDLSRLWEVPLIIGREVWSAGGWASHKAMIGMGSAWGKWEVLLEEVPKSRILTVTPATWRKKILGLDPGRYIKEQAKQTAVVYCRVKFSRDLTDHNAAEAICIAYYMVFDDKVANAIKNPGRLKKI